MLTFPTVCFSCGRCRIVAKYCSIPCKIRLKLSCWVLRKPGFVSPLVPSNPLAKHLLLWIRPIWSYSPIIVFLGTNERLADDIKKMLCVCVYTCGLGMCSY